MPREDWRRIEEILQQTLALEPGERSAFLRRACADDPERRARVEALLSAHLQPLPWLSKPVFEALPDLLAPDAPTSATGRRIGPFEIVRELGRGGMGAVYLARRADDQYHQQVAIKLIRGDMGTEEVERRFRQERQILASLEHPNIARLLGGDVTPEGRPYLIMEYVEGEAIDAYCARLGLAIDACLELFRSVCAAVQYAHRHLVVHCDLKPSNVLVTAEGVPKLLDFGIARLLAADFVPRLATTTALGRWRMTPAYASPEQIRGERLTTASDLYALGVMLYRLLTGRPPYYFEDRTPQEIQRVICEQAPERPSMAVDEEDAGAVPRSLSPERLRRRLAGDLDNIVLMALRKDPARRYASVEQLSEDLRRHMTGLPVIARRDTLLYRAGKFVRRHRLGLVATALVVISLMVGLWMANSERVRAEKERLRAESERARAEDVVAFLEGLFLGADSSGDSVVGTLFAEPGARAAQELLLDEGARRIPLALADQPVVQARLMQHIGDAYRNLGSFEKAGTLLQDSLDIRARNFGAGSPEVVKNLDQLCLLRLSQGDLERAEARCREGFEIQRATPDPDPLKLATSLNILGLVLREQGRLDESENLFRETLETRRLRLPEKHRDVTTSLNNLALVLQDKGSHADAEALFRQVLERKLERYGAAHLQVINSRNNLASILQDQGRASHDLERFAEAESLYQQALAVGRSLAGEKHPLVATGHYNLGTLLADLKRYAEAEENLEVALRINRHLYGEAHPDVARTLNSLAVVAYRQGALAEAEAHFTAALGIYRSTLGAEHPSFQNALFNLVTIWRRQGLDSKARPLLQTTLDAWRLKPPRAASALPRAAALLGSILLRARQFAEAEPLLHEGYEGLYAAFGAEHRRTQAALSRLIDLYQAWGKEGEAERYRALLHPLPD